MNIANMMKILREKERRVEEQNELLETCDCLVSFSLNIPGPVKISGLFTLLFEEGEKALVKQLSEKAERTGSFLLLPPVSLRTLAGDLFLLPVKGVKSGKDPHTLALSIKKVTAGIENEDPAGRLFDMDVLFRDVLESVDCPVKVSRTELGLTSRKCLICGEAVFSCLRAARHRVPEVMMKAVDIILSSPAVQKKLFETTEDFLSLLPEDFRPLNSCPLSAGERKIAEETALSALVSLFYEVIVTPKPGLVDTENSGSHRDMDITTFFDSAVAIAPYLLAVTEAGILLTEENPVDVLEIIRPLGLLAEKKMYEATGGVNTHKGAIFTMGVVLCACGMLIGREKISAEEIACANISPEEILELTGQICRNMPNGSRGVRTEAMNGYPSIKKSFADFREFLGKAEASAANRGTASGTSGTGKMSGELLNEALVHALLSLITVVDDENIGRRCMCDGKVWARERAAYVMAQGLTGEPFLQLVSDLDREFILRNASPGGSADLLAVTCFLYFRKSYGFA